MKILKKWKILLGLLALFGSGVLIGGVGTGVFIHHKVRDVMHGDTAALVHPIMHKLSRSLELTDAQEEAIRPIVEQTTLEIFALRDKQRPAALKIIKIKTEEIKTHLTPEQQPRMDELFQEVEKRSKVRVNQSEK